MNQLISARQKGQGLVGEPFIIMLQTVYSLDFTNLNLGKFFVAGADASNSLEKQLELGTASLTDLCCQAGQLL